MYKDVVEKTAIFNLYSDNTLTTNNLMGFIGIDDIRLTIGSRFDDNKEKQYFLQYMLAKVFAINLVNLNTSAENENIWDFLLMYMFPYYLNKALNQGLYKEYKKIKHNNANVKGTIDIARHIRQNIPFAGKIAYNTREFAYDNPITQLIRHTIEYISSREHRNALKNNPVTIENVKIIQHSTPLYNQRNRLSVIQNNYKKVNHPFFTKYEDLRKICLNILQGKGLSMQNSNNKVHGLLFDGAWLWEEYLNTLLKPFGYIHPENRTKTHGLHLFEKSRTIYPDFYSIEKEMVIDAKYKRLDSSSINREDVYQVITYMYRLKAKTGIVLYPSIKNHTPKSFKFHKDSYGNGDANLTKIALEIPQEESDFNSFIAEISENERKLQKQCISM